MGTKASNYVSPISAPTEEELAATNRKAGTQGKELSLILFSGEFDRWMAAFTLATSAAASGVSVSIFFNFWGILGLRERRNFRGKSILDRLMSTFLPKGPTRTTRLNFLGGGPLFFSFAMKKKKVAALEELITMARELGVRFIACEMSMDVMGVSAEELLPGVEIGGAATCVQGLYGKESASLFI